MTHVHISSNDIVSGFTYNGTVNMSPAVTGNITVQSHFIKPGNIPFLYPGANQLLITQIASPFLNATVFFAQTEDDSPASVNATIIAAFNATYLSGTTSVFNPLTNAYDVVISESTTLRWSSGSSTAREVFRKKVDEVAVSSFSLPADNVDSRPKYLSVHISESAVLNSSSGSDPGDFLISTFDEEVRGSIVALTATHSSLNIEFRRLNVRNVAVPFTLDWDLIFNS